jgi:surfeit locus 1 family protein
MTRFRPTLIPTLFAIPAFILLLALGTWQVYRLQWKHQIINQITRQMALPAIELPSPLDPEEFQYRKIQVSGEIVPDKELFLYTGVKEFKGDAGYDVLVPLKRADGSIILIDRGWIPVKEKASAAWKLSGPVTIDGVVMRGEKKARFTPENDSARNMWFWIDLPAISKHYQMDMPPYYILQAAGPDKHALPIGRTISALSIRNDHLQYAITWYSAAVSLLVIYYLYHRKRRD